MVTKLNIVVQWLSQTCSIINNENLIETEQGPWKCTYQTKMARMVVASLKRDVVLMLI